LFTTACNRILASHTSRPILVLPSNPLLGYPGDLFSSGFLNKFLSYRVGHIANNLRQQIMLVLRVRKAAYTARTVRINGKWREKYRVPKKDYYTRMYGETVKNVKWSKYEKFVVNILIYFYRKLNWATQWHKTRNFWRIRCVKSDGFHMNGFPAVRSKW
jgi:hypothetical protein